MYENHRTVLHIFLSANDVLKKMWMYEICKFDQISQNSWKYASGKNYGTWKAEQVIKVQLSWMENKKRKKFKNWVPPQSTIRDGKVEHCSLNSFFVRFFQSTFKVFLTSLISTFKLCKTIVKFRLCVFLGLSKKFGKLKQKYHIFADFITQFCSFQKIIGNFEINIVNWLFILMALLISICFLFNYFIDFWLGFVLFNHHVKFLVCYKSIDSTPSRSLSQS